MARLAICGTEAGDGLPHPAVTFGQQRHFEPHRCRGRRKRHADRYIAFGREGPGQRRANIVDVRCVGGGPVISRRLVFRGSFQHAAIVLRVASSNRIDFAALGELAEGIDARGLQQPQARLGAAYIRGDQRLRDQFRHLIDDLAFRMSGIGGHGSSALKRETAGE